MNIEKLTRHLLWTILCVLINFVSGCGGGTETSMGTDFNKIALSGTILNQNGQRVSGASVTVVNDPDAPSVHTNKDGTFSLEVSSSVATDQKSIQVLIEYNDSGRDVSNNLNIPQVAPSTGTVRVLVKTDPNSNNATIVNITAIPRPTPTQAPPDSGNPEPTATASAPAPTPVPPVVQPTSVPISNPGSGNSTPTPNPNVAAPSAPSVSSVIVAWRNPVIRWSASSSANVQGYRIYRKLSSSSHYAHVDSVPASQLTYQDVRATSKDEVIFYAVSAFNAGGESDRSSLVEAVPQADFDSSGCVDQTDLNFFTQQQASNPPNSPADLDGDGLVTASDLGIFAEWNGWCR